MLLLQILPSLHRIYHVFVLSHFNCIQIFVALWAVACQDPLSVGSSRQEYWSGLLCPPAGDLPNPGMEPMSVMSSALIGVFLFV